MKRFIIIALLAFLAWQGYAKYQSHRGSSAAGPESFEVQGSSSSGRESSAPSQFRCDGRTYCSQMTSCAEATFFLKNCPGVKMDGNHDGVPCEQQWCK